jgi:SpoVK/Ycf46/Vps4 family AAA+-type ATPase
LFDDSYYNSPLFHGYKNEQQLINPDLIQPKIFQDSQMNKNEKSNNTVTGAEVKKPNIVKTDVIIDVEVDNINDILKLIDTYALSETINYNINMSALHKIKPALIELKEMIGIKELKNNIVDQILYFIQGLHKSKNNSGDFMHTVLYGPPGTGKTEIAKIMGKIYSKMGILKNDTFKKVTRSDLIAGYLGQTAIKTKDVIKECIGGVLFIDEAYALGNSEKRDSFSKECIDTLCEALSDHKHDLMVIIAGYENDLNECFFNYNQGLDSRFSWLFKIDPYDAEELYLIFIKKIKEIEWEIHSDETKINVEWFKRNLDCFQSYGRDIETLFAKTKIAHSRRVFCLDESVKKKLTIGDIDKGLEIYLKNGIKTDENDNLKRIFSTMYT